MALWRTEARGSANARGASGGSSPRRQSAGPRSGDFCRPRAGEPPKSDALSQRCGAGRGATCIPRARAWGFLTAHAPDREEPGVARADAGESLRLTSNAQSAKWASCSKIPRRRACHPRRTNPVSIQRHPYSPRSRLGLPDGRQGGRRTLEEPRADPRPGDNPQDRVAATFAAPEPVSHQSRMRSRSGVEQGGVPPVFPALALGAS